jgi:hypothetical protein
MELVIGFVLIAGSGIVLVSKHRLDAMLAEFKLDPPEGEGEGD